MAMPIPDSATIAAAGVHFVPHICPSKATYEVEPNGNAINTAARDGLM
jgi:hypothetical protein